MGMDRQITKTLARLIDNGADTEKKITALSIQDILSLPGITVAEIHVITELQDAIKKHKVISYISGGTDETKEEIKETNYGGTENDEY